MQRNIYRDNNKENKQNHIYESQFVKDLFDKMSASYSKMNYITSFGFSERWRRQCVEALSIQQGETIVDLMTGMGECWRYILKEERSIEQLIALDFSGEMIKRAHHKKTAYPDQGIEILKENVFKNSIPDHCADGVCSGFGLKTFNEDQLKALAKEIERILKPNGRFSLIDVSVPSNTLLKTLYMLYLKKSIPLLGKLFLGNPETYKMLGVYTEIYQNSKQVKHIFENQGFQVEYVNYFFGCATGIKGRKL
ncbi:MAG: class I SAM-dependent methyltransferase [Saprospiraceae bacterium]|nr:class I SAM-dependent methyltransferase [Saprospiraceae bacterium]